MKANSKRAYIHNLEFCGLLHQYLLKFFKYVMKMKHSVTVKNSDNSNDSVLLLRHRFIEVYVEGRKMMINRSLIVVCVILSMVTSSTILQTFPKLLLIVISCLLLWLSL